MEHCSLEEAKHTARALRRAVQDFRFVWGDKSFNITVSMGVVPIDCTSGTMTDMLKQADAACYEAKDKGRNRIHFVKQYDAELVKRSGEIQWVSRIERALEENRFNLAFQSIWPVASAHRGEHYELLLRMAGNGNSVIFPGVFIPAAERYCLMVKVDRWVVRTALGALSRCPAHLSNLYQCSINLSGHSLGDEEFLKFIIQQFRRTEIPPHKICFEITETAAIANLHKGAQFMKALRGLGCRFALDDFGSGLSSFAYLKGLPVDYLKIDGLFVRDLADDPIAFSMVKSIHEIGHVMGKKTIAEYVLNANVLEKLREIGVNYAQGYGIAPPQPTEQLWGYFAGTP
jgi:EAL domain-containing protein (putative c-di-GMP-specific phosphodiesterase class I)